MRRILNWGSAAGKYAHSFWPIYNCLLHRCSLKSQSMLYLIFNITFLCEFVSPCNPKREILVHEEMFSRWIYAFHLLSHGKESDIQEYKILTNSDFAYKMLAKSDRV